MTHRTETDANELAARARARAPYGGAGGAGVTVVETRGDAIEGVHSVAAALCDASGNLLGTWGDGDPVTTWRSAAKPFQLATSLAALGATPDPTDDGAVRLERGAGALPLALGSIDLALGAASHSGQAAHVARVTALLAHFGLTETCLRCGAHSPVHGPSSDALVRSAEAPRAIHNNCSGKHSYMVAAAAALGDDPADYLEPTSRIQRAIAATVADMSGAPAQTVTDGCGAPCFVLPVSAMARAYACLASATARVDGESSSGDQASAPLLGVIGRAMRREPWWMSGDDRLDLTLVRGATEPLVSKVGAAGVLCVALPARGLGLAIKVLSGSDTARPVAVRHLLDRIAPGLLPPGLLGEDHVVRNVVGRVVGERRIA